MSSSKRPINLFFTSDFSSCSYPPELSVIFFTMKKPTTLVSSPSILTLFTEDLLLRILDKLTESSYRKTWRLVCKDFLRVEWLHRKTLRVFRHEYLPTLLRRYEALETLDLSVCPRIDDVTVALAFGGKQGWWARCLKTLILCRASGLRSGGLEVGVRSCPCLQELDLSYCCGLGDREASAISCAKELRDLKLVKCLGVTDVGLANIVVGCVKLERLSLKWCLEITDLGIELLSKKRTGLRALDISYLNVTNKSLNSISSLRKLEFLSMVGCSSVDDYGLHFIGNGNPSLQSIDVSRCDNVSSSGLISVIGGHEGLLQLSAGHTCSELATLLYKLMGLKKLMSISIDGARVSGWCLQTIGGNFKHLVEIGLSKCIGITDVGIAELVSGRADLKTLDLTCCHLLTDAALSAIADSCKNLVCLKLESCDFITQKGLSCIGSCCSLLEELDLTDCSGVTDAGLEYLSGCSELLCLKVGLCANVTNKGLFHIGSNFSKLHELDLYRCTGVGDDGLAAVASGCKKLKKLNLSYCTQVSDRGLKYISSLEELWDLEMRRLLKVTTVGLTAIAIGCKSLADLDMKRCCNISDAGLWALAQYSWNIRQINVSYCPISDVGLFTVMGNLKCLQNAKLVHLTHVSLEGFELALRASSDRLKKVKLLSTLKYLLSLELLQMLQARGCIIRWVEKTLVWD